MKQRAICTLHQNAKRHFKGCRHTCSQPSEGCCCSDPYVLFEEAEIVAARMEEKASADRIHWSDVFATSWNSGNGDPYGASKCLIASHLDHSRFQCVGMV